jgi:hypothetical protein
MFVTATYLPDSTAWAVHSLDNRRVPGWRVFAVAALAGGLVLPATPAAAADIGTAMCGSPNKAVQTASGNGVDFSTGIFGGTITVTATEAAVPSGFTVGICTDQNIRSNYPSDPIAAYFGIDTTQNGKTKDAPGPIHLVLRGSQLTPSSYLVLQAGPKFRETNLVRGTGVLSFDAYDFWSYAVYASCPPFANCAAGRAASPPKTTAHDNRSSLALSLPKPGVTFRSPVRDLVNVVLALVVLLLVTFPAELFNRTLDTHYDEIRAALLRPFQREHNHRKLPAPRDGGPRFAVVLAAGAILGGLLDPHAGVDLRTALAVAATLIALVCVSAVSAGTELLYRRHHDCSETARLHALPAALVVAAGCVLLSRALSFQPGYLYGVIAGLVFATRLSVRHRGRVQALAHLALLAVGVVAWLAWVPVNNRAAGAHAGTGWVLLADALGAIFVATLVSSTIRLIPLRFLPGSDVAGWHRGAWSAVFGVAVFGMLAVMFNPNSSSVRTGTSNWVAALVLLVLFGSFSVAFAGYYERRDRRRKLATADSAA